jgi:hypothetical protein
MRAPRDSVRNSERRPGQFPPCFHDSAAPSLFRARFILFYSILFYSIRYCLVLVPRPLFSRNSLSFCFFPDRAPSVGTLHHSASAPYAQALIASVVRMFFHCLATRTPLTDCSRGPPHHWRGDPLRAPSCSAFVRSPVLCLFAKKKTPPCGTLFSASFPLLSLIRARHVSVFPCCFCFCFCSIARSQF